MAMLMDVDRIKAWWVKKSGNGDRWEHALKDWLFGLVQRPVSSLVRTANVEAVGFEDQMLEAEVMSLKLAQWVSSAPNAEYGAYFEAPCTALAYFNEFMACWRSSLVEPRFKGIWPSDVRKAKEALLDKAQQQDELFAIGRVLPRYPAGRLLLKTTEELEGLAAQDAVGEAEVNNAATVLANIDLKNAVVMGQFTVEIGNAREALTKLISGVTQLSPQGREMAVTRIIELLVTVSSVLGHGSFLVSKAAVEKLAPPLRQIMEAASDAGELGVAIPILAASAESFQDEHGRYSVVLDDCTSALRRVIKEILPNFLQNKLDTEDVYGVLRLVEEIKADQTAMLAIAVVGGTVAALGQQAERKDTEAVELFDEWLAWSEMQGKEDSQAAATPYLQFVIDYAMAARKVAKSAKQRAPAHEWHKLHKASGVALFDYESISELFKLLSPQGEVVAQLATPHLEGSILKALTDVQRNLQDCVKHFNVIDETVFQGMGVEEILLKILTAEEGRANMCHAVDTMMTLVSDPETVNAGLPHNKQLELIRSLMHFVQMPNYDMPCFVSSGQVPLKFAQPLCEAYGVAATVAHFAAYADQEIVAKRNVGLTDQTKEIRVDGKVKRSILALLEAIEEATNLLQGEIYQDMEKEGLALKLSMSSLGQWLTCVHSYFTCVVEKVVVQSLSSSMMDYAKVLSGTNPRWEAFITDDNYSSEVEDSLLDVEGMKTMNRQMQELFSLQRELASLFTRLGVKPVRTHPLTESAFHFASSILESTQITAAVLAGVRTLKQARAATTTNAAKQMGAHGLKTITQDAKIAAKLPKGLLMQLEQMQKGESPMKKPAGPIEDGTRTKRKGPRTARTARTVGFKKSRLGVPAYPEEATDSGGGSPSD